MKEPSLAVPIRPSTMLASLDDSSEPSSNSEWEISLIVSISKRGKSLTPRHWRQNVEKSKKIWTSYGSAQLGRLWGRGARCQQGGLAHHGLRGHWLP